MATDEMDVDAGLLEVDELMATLRAMLAGRGKAVQAAAVTELLATFLAGWPRQNREEILAGMIEQIRAMLPVIETELYGAAGHPSNDGRG